MRFVIERRDEGTGNEAAAMASETTPAGGTSVTPAPRSAGNKLRHRGRSNTAATVVLDPGSMRAHGHRSARHPQRGAHVHPREACLAKADQKGFSRSFRQAIAPGGRHESAISVAREAAETEAIRLLRLADRQRRLHVWRPDSQAGHQLEEQIHSQPVGLLVIATDAPMATKHPEVAQAITQGRAIALGDRATISRLLGSAPADADVMHVESAPLAMSLARVWAIRNAVGQCGAAAEDG